MEEKRRRKAMILTVSKGVPIAKGCDFVPQSQCREGEITGDFWTVRINIFFSAPLPVKGTKRKLCALLWR